MLPIKKFWGLVKKTLGLLHTSDNLPGWQAVKLTFFAPCFTPINIHKNNIIPVATRDCESFFSVLYFFMFCFALS